jgi:hypothetical protein
MISLLFKKRAGASGFDGETQILENGGDRLFEVDSLRQPGSKMLVAVSEEGDKDYPEYDKEAEKVKWQAEKKFNKKFRDAVKKHMKGETDAAATPKEEEEATNDPALRTASKKAAQLRTFDNAFGKEITAEGLESKFDGDGRLASSADFDSTKETTKAGIPQYASKKAAASSLQGTCECGHPMNIHTKPPDFGCPHESEGCGCKGATLKGSKLNIDGVITKKKGSVDVVFRNKKGFVTDFGKEQVLRQPDGKTATMPRYGVWVNMRGKSEVTFVTNDFESAKSKLAKTASPVHDLHSLLTELRHARPSPEYVPDRSFNIAYEIMQTAREAQGRDVAYAAKHYIDTLKNMQQRQLSGPAPHRTVRAEERAWKGLEAAYVHFVR